MPGELKLVAVFTGRRMEAEIIKSRLESEDIPAIIRYESAGLIFGITVDGLGQASVLVPERLAEDARIVLEPQAFGETESGD